MGIEDSDKSKNPWGRGDEREKELGPEEVQKIRNEVAARLKNRVAPITGREVRRAPVTPGASVSETIASLRETHKGVFRSGQDYFRKLLEAKGGTFKQTFVLNSRGAVSGDMVGSYQANIIQEAGRESDQDKVMGLLACAMGTGQVDSAIASVPDYTTDDLRYAALWLTERYPEVQVSFEEDRSKGTFSYTASLKEMPK